MSIAELPVVAAADAIAAAWAIALGSAAIVDDDGLLELASDD